MKNLIKYTKLNNKIISKHPASLGIISQIRDGCVTIKGLDKVTIGERILFAKDKSVAVVASLEKTGEVYALIFGTNIKAQEGEFVIGSGKPLSLKLGSKIIGQIIRPFE